MSLPRVYVDFNDMLAPDSFALICRGTLDDLAAQKLTLTEGMILEVYDSELVGQGTVGKTKAGEGWPGEGRWMIKIDENGLKSYKQ